MVAEVITRRTTLSGAGARSADEPHVLLVSYNFPPVGGAGVQRPVKLIKYLPGQGVRASVLTVANASVPLRDETLLLDVPDSVVVERARTFEPSYAVKQAAWTASASTGVGRASALKRRLSNTAKQFLVPDPQILWQPGAQLALARRLMSPRAPDVVCISAPPFSQFLLGPLARLRPGTALVFDYRDEWSTYRSSYEMMSRLSVLAGEKLERNLLRLADAVITATEAFRLELLARFPFLRPEQVVAIPNGYDPDDFPPEMPEPPQDRFVLTYAGTVFKLTSARGLLSAIRLLHEREPELARLLRTRFIGRIVDTEADAFAGMEALGVERVGYMPHERLLPELSASHMALCILDDVSGTERIYPGKIFELMFLRRPCLTLSPEGALADLVRRHALGPVLPPRDVRGIAEYLAAALKEFRSGTYSHVTNPVDVERYHRGALAAEFARVFRSAAATAAARAV